ncbi:serine/threonine protein kinase [Yinghuangia sp. ASG 101]|uniref:serine/threonine-protein kinase n=1 Tax=Yinghuangia sp. ASG 101 TaxID=2896848 RepID=UPI001E6395E6|nr:serine/threonine-protein kinase [Yinghuangia sp. ASG 101]UGQ13095.1 serine/threonine protein kinase [Yinghuangia sp. ASG 101]
MSAWAPLEPGDPAAVGPFQVLARLGDGGMGRVFLARSAAGRWVAVKTIRPEFAAVGEFRRRFAHEAQAARRVSGVFTASVVDSDPVAHFPWIATAYVPAPSLRHLIRTCGPQPARTVMWLGAGIAEALQSIHAVGVVHRDLKPSNILLDEDGPRVIDFGVVHAEGTYVSTGGTAAIGTPGFMSPEQAYGNVAVTTASDVYGLGLTLIQLAQGEAPVPVHTAVDLDEPLRGIVELCLRRDPGLRPSPAEVVRLLADEVDLVAHDNAQGWLDEKGWDLVRAFRDAPMPAMPESRTQAVPPPPKVPPGTQMLRAVTPRATPAPPEPSPRRYSAARAYAPPQSPVDHATIAPYDHACRLAQDGHTNEALEAFQHANQVAVQTFGPWHAYAVCSLLGVVDATGILGWPAAARDQAASAARGAYHALGADHPFTLLVRGEHVRWIGLAGNAAGAAEAAAVLAGDYLRTMGAVAPDTFSVRGEWAMWVGRSGDGERAMRHFERLVGDCRAALGDEAMVTLDAKNAFAHWVGVTGDVTRAAHLYGLLVAEAEARYGATSPYASSVRARLEAWTAPTTPA